MDTTDRTNLGDILRASSWDEYIGQTAVKARLNLHITASNNTGRMLEHVLLEAPPGYGKTTIAQIAADLTCCELQVLKMPVKSKVLASLLREWDGGILFLDEIHRGSKSEQEDLLSLLEEGYLQLDNGRRVYAGALTVIGATTDRQKVITPLRDRFPIKPRFVEYTDPEMGLIVAGMARKVGLEFGEGDCEALGRACGGTPRVARDLIFVARALADTGVTPTVAEVLASSEMQPDGLSADHMAYLTLMWELGGVGIGMTTLSTILRLDEQSVRDLETLLLRKKLIQLEKTGRELTNAGFALMKPTKKGNA